MNQLLTCRIVRPVSWASCFFWSSLGYGCVKCWNNHALRIFVATLGKMPRFLSFFFLVESSSSQPSVPSPLPTLALLASPKKSPIRKKIIWFCLHFTIRSQHVAIIITQNNKFIRGIHVILVIFAWFQNQFQLYGKQFVDGKPHCCEYQVFVNICLKPFRSFQVVALSLRIIVLMYFQSLYNTNT